MTPRPGEHWHPVGYFEWLKVLRVLPLSMTVKAVGYALATYADYDTGAHAHPGGANLMMASGAKSNKTVIAAMAELRRQHLLARVVSGSAAGRRGLADEYILTVDNYVRVAAGLKPCECELTAEEAIELA